MSDDIWRNDDDASGGRAPGRREREMDDFDDDEFGGPLFGETTEQPVTSGDEPLKLGDDSGPLPDWTAPATGEVPRIEATERVTGDGDDVDVWSSFTAEVPTDTTGELTWGDGSDSDPDDGAINEPVDTSRSTEVPAMSEVDEVGAEAQATTAHDAITEPQREPARITIGTDPSGMPRRPDPRRRGTSPQRPPTSSGGGPSPDGRNLPVAVATGLLLAAVFLALTMWRPAGAVAFVTVALGLASFEYFAKVTEKGYRPAVAAGVAACVAAPLAAYWVGDQAVPLVIAFAFIAAALSFIAADSIETGPMPNMAITMLGVVWIGMMGAFAALILRWSTFGDGTPWGTDTLVLLAIGVVANDVGAYFVGTAFGRTPLRGWISPNKSLEGLLGGTILTLVIFLVIGIQDFSTTWDTSNLLWFAIVISALAPLGDLTESMFKRNLDVKDFGAIIRGHGGVLDRFDGFLFALPGAYYLMLVLEPWAG
ncbi:MAG: phosphatidate cytidylyltransferase [Actinomycetota bacterium]